MAHICALNFVYRESYWRMNNTDERFVKQFGIRVRFLRKQYGFTQDDLSAKTDIPRTQIGRIERGEINTTITTSKIIATALEVSVKDLFEFE